MKKGKIMGKILGIALIFVTVGLMLGKVANRAGKVTNQTSVFCVFLTVVLALSSLLPGFLPRQAGLVSASSQTELIINGGFESGSTGWSVNGDFYADSRFSYPHSGTGYAYLSNADGTYGNNLGGTLEQTVTIPSSATSATFTFWYSVTTNEPGSTPYDLCDVIIFDTHYHWLATAARLDNTDSQSPISYSKASLDLTDYVGQTVKIVVEATTDASYPTVFRLDDFSILATLNEAPTCSVSAYPTSGNAPLDVTFTMSASDPDGSISVWGLDADGDASFDYSGAGNPPSTQPHKYTTPGTYIAAFMVLDNDGANCWKTVTIVAGENEPPTCSLSPDKSSGKAPLAVTFSISASDSDGWISSWELDPDDGSPTYSGTGNPPSTKAHTYTAAGTYTAILGVTDNEGATRFANKTIIVNPPDQGPTADFSADVTDCCEPLEVQFTDESTAGDNPITSWSWSFGDGDTSTEQNPSHTYDTPGTYTVSLTVTDSNGYSDTETKTDYITANAGPMAAFSADVTSCCEPLAVQFTDESTAGSNPITSWYWDFGDGDASTAQNPGHTYNSAGTYTVSLTVTDSHGCSDTETKVNYITANAGPMAAFSADVTSCCDPLTVRFTDLSTTGDNPIVSWYWDFGDEYTSTDPNPSHTYDTGTYTVSLTVTDSQGYSDTQTKENYITSNEGPMAGFSADVTSCSLTVQFSDESIVGGNPIVSWYWDFDDGGTSTAQNPSHTYDDGTYTVSLTVTDEHGCSDTETRALTIDPALAPRLVITSPLRITRKEVTSGFCSNTVGGPCFLDIPALPYFRGDTLTASFTVENIGSAPITLDKLGVGGRFNSGQLPDGEYPDFPFKSTVLNPGDSYSYAGDRNIPYAGDYHFFCAYQTPDGTWNPCIELGEGLTDEDRIEDIKVEYIASPNPSSDAVIEISNMDGISTKELYDVIKLVLSIDRAKSKVVGQQNESLLEDVNLLLDQLDPGKRTVRTHIEPELPEDTWLELKVIEKAAAPALGAGLILVGFVLLQPEFIAAGTCLLVLAEPISQLGWITEVLSMDIGQKVFGEGFAFVTVKDPVIGRMDVLWLGPPMDKIVVNIYLAKAEKKGSIVISVGQWLNELKMQWGINKQSTEPIWNAFAYPPENTLGDPQSIIDYVQIIGFKSPGELRVYDSQGRVTGLINGEVKEEFPGSVYDNELKTVVLFSPIDTYSYEVAGTEEGTYGLELISVEEGEAVSFTAVDIPTTAGAVHNYVVDWDTLSQGDEGVTVQIDSDGDGEFEETVVTSQPNTPSNPAPTNNATAVSVDADLNWTGGDPDAGENVTYSIYFGTNSTPAFVETIGPFAANQTSLNYDLNPLAYNTTYYWQVVARDNHGITREGPVWDFTTGLSVSSYNISLAMGWNLVSLPLIPDSNNITDVLADIIGNVTIVRYYNATAAGWLGYIPGNPASTLATMEDGLGYWIFMSSPATLNVSGQELPDPPAPPPTYDVVLGWNLIGFSSTTSMSLESYLASIAGSYLILRGYDPGEGYFTVYPAGAHGGNMESGHGYWIWTTADGTIVPPT